MVIYACQCLNIRVHGRGTVRKPEDSNKFNLPTSVSSHSFFSEKIYDVTLDLSGATMSQESLCKTTSCDNWAITTCTCCKMDVFAKHVDNHDKVLVSTKTETDSDTLLSLMNSESYSPIFKMILPEINDSFIQNNMGIEFQNGNIHQSIEVTQTQVSNYLKEEQKAMEERIRQFTHNEQAKYTSILQRVRKNKQAMIYLLSKCKENEKGHESTTPHEPMLVSSTCNRDSATESSTSTDSAFDKNDPPELALQESSKKQNIKVLRRTVSNPGKLRTKGKKELRRAPASIDVGGVFDMEDIETTDILSSCSDEFSDESENEGASDAKEETSNCNPLYGTSVPMSVPGFSKIPRYSQIETKEDMPKNPQDIAASMRALACSVSDGTEMFGELPRRRLNTGELLASRRPF